MNNALDIINYWISGKYRLSPVTINWIYANMQPLDDLKATYEAMTYDVETANNKDLDYIGELVGIRRVSLPSKSEFFGWLNQSSFARSWEKAPWYNRNQQALTPINNELYRRAIKAKIIKNVSDGTFEYSLFAASNLAGQPCELKRDFTDFSMWFEFETDLDDDTLILINSYDLACYPTTARFKGFNKRAA